MSLVTYPRNPAQNEQDFSGNADPRSSALIRASPNSAVQREAEMPYYGVSLGIGPETHDLIVNFLGLD
jgi:hypothetical protein